MLAHGFTTVQIVSMAWALGGFAVAFLLFVFALAGIRGPIVRAASALGILVSLVMGFVDWAFSPSTLTTGFFVLPLLFFVPTAWLGLRTRSRDIEGDAGA